MGVRVHKASGGPPAAESERSRRQAGAIDRPGPRLARNWRKAHRGTRALGGRLPTEDILHLAEVRYAVVVVAKIGLLGEKGRVRTPAGIFGVHSGDDNWHTVEGPVTEGAGRVRYDDERSLLEIQRPGISLSIHFRPELEHTTFELNGHLYEIGTMDFGDITIKEGNLRVVRGHGTISGVRILEVAPELESVERELAFGLALRSAVLDKDLWDEDHPLWTRFGLR